MSSRSVAQRHQMQPQHAQPKEEVGTKTILAYEHLEVLIGRATTLTSARSKRRRRADGRRGPARSGGASPATTGDSESTSSKDACRLGQRNESLLVTMCVGEGARSCPNSSFSNRCSGTAPQSTGMNGKFRRRPRWCSARAHNSLPVPVSPVIRIGRLLRASAGRPRHDVQERRCAADQLREPDSRYQLAVHGFCVVGWSPRCG
jgi:hypothetical protein